MEWSHHPQSARTQRRNERHEPRLQLGDAHRLELDLLDGGPRAVLSVLPSAAGMATSSRASVAREPSAVMGTSGWTASRGLRSI
jgi:hypothetical protein